MLSEVQVLRYSIALALVGCVQFDRPPERTPDAGQPLDASDAFDETLSEAANRVIATWQSCLTTGDVELSGLALRWPPIVTEMGQTCNECHSGGANGFLVNDNAAVLASTLKSNRSLLLGYFTVDLTRGPSQAAMVINTAIQEAVSQGQAPYQTHPKYNPSDGLAASESLRQLVQGKVDTNQCDN